MNKRWNVRVQLTARCRDRVGTIRGIASLLAVSLVVACDRHAEDSRQSQASGHTSDSTLAVLVQPTNATVVSSVKTVRAVRTSRPMDIRAEGIVGYDTRGLSTIAARFGGRIEHIHVHALLEPIRKGQPLMDIYSPEIVTAQRELIFLLDSDSTNTSLIRSATDRLRLLGITDVQIAALKRTRQPNYAITVYSPFSGYVIESGGAPVDMGADRKAMLFHNGQYITRGQTLFRLADPARAWVELRLPASDAALVQQGTRVTLTFDQLSSKPTETSVMSVVPVLDSVQRYSVVRVSLGKASMTPRIGQLARAVIHAPSQSGRWLPVTAVQDLGDRQVVFRKQGDAFRAVPVTTGIRAQGFVEILRGITEMDDVAEHAQLLVDSEGFVTASSRKQP